MSFSKNNYNYKSQTTNNNKSTLNTHTHNQNSSKNYKHNLISLKSNSLLSKFDTVKYEILVPKCIPPSSPQRRRNEKGVYQIGDMYNYTLNNNNDKNRNNEMKSLTKNTTKNNEFTYKKIQTIHKFMFSNRVNDTQNDIQNLSKRWNSNEKNKSK